MAINIPKDAHVAGRVIKSANFRNTELEWGYNPAASTDQFEVLYISGLNGTTPVGTLADASVATTATGRLFVAMHDCEPRTDNTTHAPGRMHPGPTVIGPLDTSAYTAVGSGVYLSDTAGALSPTTGTITRVVGSVVVKDATNGYILFDGTTGTTLPA